MITRALTAVAAAAALAIGLTVAYPAEATGPLGGIFANGTQLNGLAQPLREVVLDSIWMHGPDEDDGDAPGTGCQEGPCPRNGTRLNGLALQGVTLARIQREEAEVGNSDVPDLKESPPASQAPSTAAAPSARDMMLQIQASPGGIQVLKEAELRSAPIQKAMANFSTACEPSTCLEVTPYKPGIGSWGNYGFHIWGQNTTWVGQSSSFWLTAPPPAEPPRFKQGTPLLVAQSYDNHSGGWHVIAFELCRQNHDGRFYEGPVVGRLFHGVDSSYPRKRLPSDAALLNTWQLTIDPGYEVSCHMFPALIELTRGDHAFVFELEVGDLSVQRVTLRRL